MSIPTQEQHFSVLFSDEYVYFKMRDFRSCHGSVEKESNMVVHHAHTLVVLEQLSHVHAKEATCGI